MNTAKILGDVVPLGSPLDEKFTDAVANMLAYAEDHLPPGDNSVEIIPCGRDGKLMRLQLVHRTSGGQGAALIYGRYVDVKLPGQVPDPLAYAADDICREIEATKGVARV